MKRFFAFIFLFLFLFVSTGIAHASALTPAWFKAGTVLGYYANGTMKNAFGVNVIYVSNGCFYSIGAQRISVKFRVLKIENGSAIVKVTLRVFGDPNLPMFIGPNLPNPHRYVSVNRERSCPKLPGNLYKSFPMKAYNDRVINDLYNNLSPISGVYRIDLGNASVYSLNGTPYGHTLLYDLYPSKKNELVIFNNGRWVHPKEVDVLNVTYVTYHGDFPGPNVVLKYSLQKITSPWGPLGAAGTVVNFNPGEDVSVGLLGVIPDLEAIGVKAIGVMDNMIEKYNQKLNEMKTIDIQKLGKYPPLGVILSNLTYPHSASLPSKQPKPPSSNSLPLVAGVLALLLVVLAIWRRSR